MAQKEKSLLQIMKKIILLALTALMMVGCEYQNDAKIEEAKRLNGFKIVVVDSCEYLKDSETYGYSGYGYFSHKQRNVIDKFEEGKDCVIFSW
jgi:hypothetical protein